MMSVLGHAGPDHLGVFAPFLELIIVLAVLGGLLAYYSHKAKRERATRTALVVRSKEAQKDATEQQSDDPRTR